MNMPVADINRLNIEKQLFAPKQAMRFADIRQHADSDVLNSDLEPNEVLDQHFALQNGSHKDVKQYVIYFCHIMAFFEDGSHCGLESPKQFVAYLGYKDTPESIVLKGNDGHIELILNTRSNMDAIAKDGSTINIEYPTQSTFTSAKGDDYFVE